MSEKWVKKWEVPGSNDHTWIVSVDKDNKFGCSCPVWKFKRQECKHIIYVKNNAEFLESGKERPEYVLASVLKPKFDKKKNKLYIPLIAFNDPHLMEATICYYMLKHGFSWNEIKKIRGHIPKEWTAKAIINHVEINGEAEYPEGWYGGKNR